MTQVHSEFEATLHAPTWAEFCVIAERFVAAQQPSLLLGKIYKKNKKLAETLLLFRQRLRKAREAAQIFQQVYTHYVINTDGPLPQSDKAHSIGVFDWAREYASQMQIEILHTNSGTQLLREGQSFVVGQWSNQDNHRAAHDLRAAGITLNKSRYGRPDVIPCSLFPFDEQAAGHSKPNAMWMAELSELAYHSPAFIKQQLLGWQYQDLWWIASAATDTEAFVAVAQGHLVVSFRGTSSLADAMTDLRFRKTAGPGGRGRIHRGFNKAFESIWEPLQKTVSELGNDRRIFVTGHSLGAALAQLAAYRLADSGRDIAAVYVYGSPSIGDEDFAQAYNALLGDQTFLHINNQDAVTRVPPRWLRFRRMGRPTQHFAFTGRGHKISQLEEDREDPPPGLAFDSENDVILTADIESVLSQKTRDVGVRIRQSTSFLTKSPVHLESTGYRTVFETGAADDHAIFEYLFKFACALVDDEWKKLQRHTD